MLFDDVLRLAQLHVRWSALHDEQDWSAMPAAMAAGYAVYRAEAAIAAGDGSSAKRAWRDAVTLRPDSYGLRALQVEVQGLPAEVHSDQRLTVIHRIRAVMDRTPVARAPLPGQMYLRIDQLD